MVQPARASSSIEGFAKLAGPSVLRPNSSVGGPAKLAGPSMLRPSSSVGAPGLKASERGLPGPSILLNTDHNTRVHIQGPTVLLPGPPAARTVAKPSQQQPSLSCGSSLGLPGPRRRPATLAARGPPRMPKHSRRHATPNTATLAEGHPPIWADPGFQTWPARRGLQGVWEAPCSRVSCRTRPA